MPFNENKRKQARPDEKQLQKKIEDRTKLFNAAIPSRDGITTKQLSEDTGLSRPTINKWMRNAPDSFVKEGSFQQVNTDIENVWIPKPLAQYKGEKIVQGKPIKMGSLDLPPHASGKDLFISTQISGLHNTLWVDFDLESERKRIDCRPHSGDPSYTEFFWTNIGGQQSIPIRARGVNKNGQCAIQAEVICMPSDIDHEKLWDQLQQEKEGIQGGFEVETVPLKLLENKETKSSHPSWDTERRESNSGDSTNDGGWIKSRMQRIDIWSDGD